MRGRNEALQGGKDEAAAAAEKKRIRAVTKEAENPCNIAATTTTALHCNIMLSSTSVLSLSFVLQNCRFRDDGQENKRFLMFLDAISSSVKLPTCGTKGPSDLGLSIRNWSDISPGGSGRLR